MRAYPLTDNALARRIEAAGVADLCAYVDASRASGVYPDARSFRVAGGVAVWFCPGNVVNGSYGLGMSGPVEHEEVAALIAFHAECGAPARVDVCPLADRSLMRWLAEERFAAAGFETVLYQPLPASVRVPVADGVRVRVASTTADRELWADLEARGFTDDRATPEDYELARAIALRDDALSFIGYLHDEPVGTGMLVISDGIAMFNGDSTLPAARNRGVQSALLAERLRYAEEAGCDLGVIEAQPGGTSQRNQERAGFRVAYTRVTLERPQGV